jgi:GT2 family glycosyltransferase
MSTGVDSLGVVILSFGHDTLHWDLVEELCVVQGISPAQIVIIHNAYDPTDAWLPPTRMGEQVIGTGDNLGYAAGMNIGILGHRENGRRWILCLTHEARLRPGCVERLIYAGESDAQLGVIGPVLTAPGSATPWSTGLESIFGGLRHAGSLPLGASIVRRISVDGSVMLVRSDAFADAGPLDERMFMYWEETEFCLRVRRAGWDVAVAAEAVATAVPGGAGRSIAHAYLTARNGLLYSQLLGGRRAVVARALRMSSDVWRLIPKPLGRRFRKRAMWRIAATRTRGTLLGACDFARRRFGRPPPSVIRGTDIRPPRS